MKDRLGHLHQVHADSDGVNLVEMEALPECDAATASGPDLDLDGILQEAQSIRLEIQQIQNDISELKDINYHALNRTSHPVATKRDPNAIGMDIKRRGEATLQRLHQMNAVRDDLEVKRGAADPAARVARTQYQCLSRALHEVMFSYNDAEVKHKDACRRQIQRQMEVVGREVGREDLEEMMESGELKVFSPQLEGKTARSAFLQIESRHQELAELERRLEGVQELFMDVALLVEEQGEAAEDIQKNVQTAEAAVQEGVVQLDRAVATDKKNPLKSLFCGCFPCYR
ncbi:syntaxin-11-like [Antennarius striatus]|uniref:syntaxin-11-like n=1 Tax=Antennarius striatus TaxID=241820 RepID=UPI0035AD99D9